MRKKTFLNHPKEERNSFNTLSLCKILSPTALRLYVNNEVGQ